MAETNSTPGNGLFYKQITSEIIGIINPPASNSSSDKIKLSFDNNTIDLTLEKQLDKTTFGKSGYFIAYLDYAVLVGCWEFNCCYIFNLKVAPGLSLDFDFLQKIRLFNESSELLLIRNSPDKYSGRLRIDNNQENEPQRKKIDVIDCSQIIFGTKAELFDGTGCNWVRLTEERGTEIILPSPILNSRNISDLGKNYLVALKVRNYVDYHKESHQAFYSDHRIINFEIKDIPV